MTNDKVVEIDAKEENKASIEEMREKIESMKKDQQEKCAAAKKQLIDMLDVTISKYLTATGTAEALRVLRFTYGDNYNNIAKASQLAHEMSETVSSMKGVAGELAPFEMDKLCDGFYEKDFTSNDPCELAREMMKIDLCRNVGGSAEDMVEFVRHVDEEIKATQDAIHELEKEDD